MDSNNFLKELSVDIKKGLSSEDVISRRNMYGFNSIEEKKNKFFLLFFINQLKNPLNIILIFAGILTSFLKEYLDMYIIFSAVLLNIIISLFQESKTNKTFQKLNKLKEFNVLVKRDSLKTIIPSKEIVVGDIVFLNAGDKIPADIILFKCKYFKVNESSFTGESADVEKKESDLVFSGSIVKSGYAIGIVSAVGKNTKFGQILLNLENINKRPSSIAEKMKKISVLIGIIAAISIFVVVIGGAYSGFSIYTLIILAVSVAISAIPEGLAASISAALAVGMHRLLKKGILVKDLVSTEKMASVDTILTDKTGTLTEGNMVLKTIFPNTDDNVSYETLLRDAYLSSDVFFDLKSQQFIGDEMDVAISNYIEDREVPFKHIEIDNGYEIIEIMPFSSENRFFAKFVKDKVKNKKFIFIKGAPELILEKSKNISKKNKNKFEKILKEKQDAYNRFLGFSYLEVNSDFNFDSFTLDINGLNFLGLISFLDPLKKSVKNVLNEVKNMGLNLIMVTGDSNEVAISVARESGLIDEEDSKYLEGSDIEKMSYDDLYKVTEEVKIFSRVSPKAKLKLAEAFIHNGHRIAMTGDGVNDVLALTKADIGITFTSASEAAREAASLILKKNDFNLILVAIKEAQNVIKNIQKTVVYLLSSSFSVVIVILGSIFIGGPMPFLAIHILWANIAEEGLINFAFIFGKNKNEDNDKKFNPKILTKKIKEMIFLLGIFDTVFLFLLYIFLIKLGFNGIKLQSLMFLGLSINFSFIAYSIANLKKLIFKTNIFSNKYLNYAIITGFLLIGSAIFVPSIRHILKLEPFSITEIIYLLLFGVSYLFATELFKYFLYIRKKNI